MLEHERWAVAANFVGRRVFRWGAKLRVIFFTGGDCERVRVEGLNFYGRTVDAWVHVGDLRDFRPMWHRSGDHATKAGAAAEAELLEGRRRIFGSKCPLLTWAQHYRAATGK